MSPDLHHHGETRTGGSPHSNNLVVAGGGANRYPHTSITSVAGPAPCVPRGILYDPEQLPADRAEPLRVEDVDEDGLTEFLANYGPAAAQVDVYSWDGAAYVYQETLSVS